MNPFHLPLHVVCSICSLLSGNCPGVNVFQEACGHEDSDTPAMLTALESVPQQALAQKKALASP